MGNRKQPFGYKMALGKIVIQESEAKLVQEIFLRYIAGESLNELTESLRQQDIPYDEGRLWNKNMVARILADIRRQFTIPVLIISAKETTQNKIDLLRLGADDYITKPFDMEEVLARIESNLRRVQFENRSAACLQYGDLCLDLEKNTAFLKEAELALTAKEFAILELLMKYPDKVFSKSNLFQSVWNTEYFVEDNTLNVHISNLRNKLKAVCPDKEFIDTVWGIGYRLHKAKE
jgi:DNA-binding response OmpR family regulator